MNRFDLKHDLEDLEIEKRILEKKIEEIEERNAKLCERINVDSIFDKTIVFLIADLMTKKEGIYYSPFTYKKTSPFYSGYLEELYVGIAPDDNISELLSSKDENINKFFEDKKGYELYKMDHKMVEVDKGNRVCDFYFYGDYEDNTLPVSFPFLKEFFQGQLPYYNFNTMYDFNDFKYVQDYIFYLFEIKLNNGDKPLTYEEMADALNEFLKLDREKVRTLK